MPRWFVKISSSLWLFAPCHRRMSCTRWSSFLIVMGHDFSSASSSPSSSSEYNRWHFPAPKLIKNQIENKDKKEY
ncbi:hypothetical protein HanIR_Chr15g0753471 [Helianthus annuus]|nr:hypothetical protein HanIR_Chr15g0753471 [Helianthus annuus]